MELSNKDYDNPYKYNGKEFDSQTGLYYYGARYYDPQRSFWLSVDPLVEITMSPYAYTWNDPVNYSDPTGMIGERIGDPGGPNPDSIWHVLTWSKAHRNAQRYANSMQFGDNTVNMYEHNDGDWSVNTSYGNGLHNRATFSNKGEVYNKDYGIYVGNIQGQNEGSNTVTNYPAPDFNSPTIKSPSDNPYANPSSQLAYTTLIAMQEAPFVIAPELIPAKYINMARGIVCAPVRQLTKGLIEICFTKGTLVATEKGNKNIEDINEGDLVWSYNEETGKKELKKVVELSQNTSSSLVKISVNGTEIICTPEHPFYVNGDWIEAKDLAKGMSLTSLDGDTYTIKSINFLDGKVEVYNFEVEGNHNYYVSEKGVLVHNNCLQWLSKARNLKVIRSGCEVVADRAVKSLGEGAEYLQITPRFGNQLGNVAGENSGWSWHVAATKNGMVYDRLTGSAGMKIEQYKQLFEYHTDLIFEVVSKRTLK